jgi:hypothetical protein
LSSSRLVGLSGARRLSVRENAVTVTHALKWYRRSDGGLATVQGVIYTGVRLYVDTGSAWTGRFAPDNWDSGGPSLGTAGWLSGKSRTFYRIPDYDNEYDTKKWGLLWVEAADIQML